MEYMDVESARQLPGLRLALTTGVPGPYSMAARSLFDLRGVPYTPVAQQGGGANPELVAWTRHRNAPVAVYNDEPPRVSSLDIINLAERLGSGPSLFPDEMADRVTMVGLINEMGGENGLLWNMRLIMLGLAGPERAAEAAKVNPMYTDYGYSEAARELAPAKVKAFLGLLEGLLQGSSASGHRYIIGDRLTAADVYWAWFSQVFVTLPEDQCPMPGYLRKSYDLGSQVIGGCSNALIDHRDFIFTEHLKLPATF